MWYEFLILVIAGVGAGVITGLIGASAVVFAAPLLVIFLGMSGYDAIGISLGIDVFASIVATLWFGKKGNIKYGPGILMAVFAIIGAFAGSYFSSGVSSQTLITITGFGILITATNLMFKRVEEIHEEGKEIKKRLGPLIFKRKKVRIFLYCLAGVIIGFIGGSIGSGGGLSIIIVLTIISRYRTHQAVGTAVFVMSFLALSGAIGHFVYSSFMVNAVIIGGIAAIIGSFAASVFANWLSEWHLNKVASIVLYLFAITMILRAFGIFTIWGV